MIITILKTIFFAISIISIVVFLIMLISEITRTAHTKEECVKYISKKQSFKLKFGKTNWVCHICIDNEIYLYGNILNNEITIPINRNDLSDEEKATLVMINVSKFENLLDTMNEYIDEQIRKEISECRFNMYM